MTPADLSRRSFMELVGATGAAAGAREAVDGTPTADMGSADDQGSSIPIENQLVVAFDRGADLPTVESAAMSVVREESQQAHFGLTVEDLGLLKINLVGEVTTENRDAIKEEIANQEPIEAVSVEQKSEPAVYDPNDPRYRRGEQEYLDLIDGELAWQFSRGDDQMIAIVEGKVDTEHPDLGDRFVEEKGLATKHQWRDANGEPATDRKVYAEWSPKQHPTQTAGCAASSHNNDEGIAAISTADFFNVAVENNEQSTDTRQFAATDIIATVWVAIRWTAAKIINVSTHKPTNLEEAIQQNWNDTVSMANRNKNLIVKSAGNYTHAGPQNKPVGGMAVHEDVLAVGSIDRAKNLAGFSARGPGLDVCAPGDNILTTDTNPRAYNRHSGTSISAPIVSGVAALMLDTHQQMGAQQMRDQLRNATVDIYDDAIDGDVPLVKALLAIFKPPEGSVFNEQVENFANANIGQNIYEQYHSEVDNSNGTKSWENTILYNTYWEVLEAAFDDGNQE